MRAPGWYDDPDDPTNLRYFDGVEWSRHISPKVKPGLDRAQQAVVDDAPSTGDGHSGGASGGETGSGSGQGQQPNRGWAPGGSSDQGAGSGNVQGQGGHHGPGNSGGPWAPGGQRGGYPGDHGHQGGYPGQHGQQQSGFPHQGGHQGGWGAPQVGYVDRRPQVHGRLLAGWWLRFLARLIDGLVVLFVGGFIGTTFIRPDFLSNYTHWIDGLLTSGNTGFAAASNVPQHIVDDIVVLSLVVAISYALYEILLLGTAGATLGKLATGLRVIQLSDGQQPSWNTATIRALVWVAPFAVGQLPLIGLLGTAFVVANGLWPAWDPQRQSLNDKVAKTAVVTRSYSHR